MLGVGVVQMPVVQIIHMVAVLNGGVSAVFAVNVGVVSMSLAVGHFVYSYMGWLKIYCARIVNIC